MPLIREAILTTLDADGLAHIAPLGLTIEGENVVLAPFHPSRTLTNLRATPRASASFPDDARVFAGLLTGRRDWPLASGRPGAAPHLADALGYLDLEVIEAVEDPVRPRFVCRVAHAATLKAYPGFNRAFAAVVEGAVLVSRLRLLPRARIEEEMARLAVVVDKTADAREREAWSWLAQAAEEFWTEAREARRDAG